MRFKNYSKCLLEAGDKIEDGATVFFLIKTHKN